MLCTSVPERKREREGGREYLEPLRARRREEREKGCFFLANNIGQLFPDHEEERERKAITNLPLEGLKAFVLEKPRRRRRRRQKRKSQGLFTKYTLLLLRRRLRPSCDRRGTKKTGSEESTALSHSTRDRKMGEAKAKVRRRRSRESETFSG